MSGPQATDYAADGGANQSDERNCPSGESPMTRNHSAFEPHAEAGKTEAAPLILISRPSPRPRRPLSCENLIADFRLRPLHFDGERTEPVLTGRAIACLGGAFQVRRRV